MSRRDISRALGGKIATPIRRMMESNRYGRVIFIVRDFQEKFNTRTAALNNARRWDYDIYTRGNGKNELHVIRRGCEDLGALYVDLAEVD